MLVRLRRPTRGVLVLLAIGAFAIAILSAGRLLQTDAAADVHGAVTQVGDLRMRFGSQPDGGISPACGCAHPPVSAWRGITFAARKVTIERTGGSRWSEWVMSAPEEGPTWLYQGHKRFNVRLVRLRLRDDGPLARFKPRWLFDRDLLARRTVVDVAERTHAHVLKVINRGRLHVGMFGPVPVAAWIPMPGSSVRLASHVSPFPGEPPVLSLDERYPQELGVGARTLAGRRQGYPLGDFLGPRLVIWTDDPTARVPGTALRRPGGRDVVTVVLIEPQSFSTRLGVSPLSDDELDFVEDHLRAHRGVARHSVHWGAGDDGRVAMRVARPLSEAEYRRLRDRVRRQPTIDVTTWIDELMSVDGPASSAVIPAGGDPSEWVLAETFPVFDADTATEPDGTMESLENGAPIGAVPNRQAVTITERYPPLPSNAGFNVFGPLRRLELDNVRGSIAIGDRTVQMDAPSELQLTDVRGLRDAEHRQLVPIPLSTEQRHADLQFHAVSRVRVNGVVQTRFAQLHGQDLSDVLTIAGLLGTLISVLGLVFNLGWWAVKGGESDATS